MTTQTRLTEVQHSDNIASQVLDILEMVTGSDQVRIDLDLPLLDLHLLDSLGMAEILLSLSETLGVEISPAEIERDRWASPRLIIAFVEERIRK